MERPAQWKETQKIWVKSGLRRNHTWPTTNYFLAAEKPVLDDACIGALSKQAELEQKEVEFPLGNWLGSYSWQLH